MMIDNDIRRYRALIVWTNNGNSGEILTNWFAEAHKKYIKYDLLAENLIALGYNVDINDCENCEIFNIESGIFRDIILQYKKTNDINRLNTAIRLIMSYRPTFYIINETIDKEIINSIISMSNLYHFSNLLFYCKKPVTRLKNLNYIENLRDNENTCREINNFIFHSLNRRGVRFAGLMHEDFFQFNSYNDSILYLTFKWLFYSIHNFIEIREKINHIDVNTDHIEAQLVDLIPIEINNFHIEV